MQGHDLGQLEYRNESKSTINVSFATGCYTTKVARVSGINYPWAWLNQPLPLQVQGGGFRATRKQLRYAPDTHAKNYVHSHGMVQRAGYVLYEL